MVRKLKIGNVELQNNIILAPMAGLTDLPFRLVCEKYNPGLVVTEMVSSRALYYNDEKTKQLLKMNGEKRPISVQIFGSDIESMAYGANYVSKIADIVDINMGCPAPKIVKNGDGSKLLLDLNKVYEIVKTVVRNSTVPVTVKIRKGWDSEHIVAVEAAKAIESAGASAIAVHGRTRAEYYTGVADWDIIKKVKDNVSIPVIGNGDIISPEDAKRIFEQTNCDGIMIGRATLGKPWILEQIRTYLDNGTIRKISNEEKLETILNHIKLEIEEKGEYTGVREMRKHICFYLKGLPGASTVRDKINHLDSKKDVEKELINFFHIIQSN